MKDSYKVLKLSHCEGSEYEVIIEIPSEETIVLQLHEELILKYRLVEGKEILVEDMAFIFEHLNFGKVYQNALRILTRQPYTKKELMQKLQSRKFEIPLIMEAIKKLEEVGLLDDGQYAISYIQHHGMMGKKGPNIIRQDLLQKGILEQVINKYISNYTEELQNDHIKRIIGQQLRLNKKYGPYMMKQKIYHGLINKGFDSSLIEANLNEIEITQEEEENPILVKQAEKLFLKYEKLEAFERKNKMIQALMRKGFSYDEVISIYEKLKEEA